MNAEQFMWWMGGVLAIAPTDTNLATKAQALDTIRAQLASVLVGQQLGTLVYPPGVRGPGNEQRRAQVVGFYEQQQRAADAERRDQLERGSFGSIPAPEDEAQDLTALMVERGYQPKGQ